MLVYDMRLAGATPAHLAGNNYEVDGTVPVQHAFDWVHSYAQTQGGAIDFGSWEGAIYNFSSDDGSPTQVNAPPQPSN